MSILGIDVSDAQGAVPSVHWQAVALDKRFVWNECTIGNDGNSKYFDQNVAGQKAEGLINGAYLFCECLLPSSAHPGRDPEYQVQQFFEACQGLGARAGELAPALDLEDPDPGHWIADGVTPNFLEDWTGRAADRVFALWGVKPIIYTYPYWARMANLVKVGKCDLWLAVYGESPIIPFVAPWTSAAAYQTGAGTYRLPSGAPCDEDEIADAATLARLTAGA